MRTWPSLIGQRFGMLTVMSQESSSVSGHRRWRCQCDCGNICVVSSPNLTGGRTTSCGCRKYRDLAGQHIGRLTVLERSERYADRGQRQVQLWRCRCDCGAIVYKATDTLTNEAVSMCRSCAQKYSIQRAREEAGFVGGTQIARIRAPRPESDNLSGARGVYLDHKTGKYRARIKFQGKLYNLGTFTTLEDAVAARRAGEEQYFGAFLEAQSKENDETML